MPVMLREDLNGVVDSVKSCSEVQEDKDAEVT